MALFGQRAGSVKKIGKAGFHSPTSATVWLEYGGTGPLPRPRPRGSLVVLSDCSVGTEECGPGFI